MQRALLQWKKPENHALIRQALRQCGREDLIGFAPKCLVPPAREKEGRFGSVQRQGDSKRGQERRFTGGKMRKF